MPRVRVFLEQDGALRRVFELRASNTDASLYVHPAAPSGVYDYGLERFETDAPARTFNPSSQLHATSEPHLSIKQSGQVHIRTPRGPLAGPLEIIPLADLRGEHVATVTATRCDTFPTYRGDRSNLHAERDRVTYADTGIESVRYAVHVNGEASAFTAPSERLAFTVTLHNRSLSRPVHVGVAFWGQDALGEDSSVVVIGGYDPRAPANAATPFVFLRGR